MVVSGQVLTTTAPPADTPAPLAVITVAKCTYAQAAATPFPGWSYPHLRPAKGRGAATGGQLCRPLLVLEKGPKVFKLQVGIGRWSSRGAGTAGGCRAAMQGSTAPTSGLDLPQHFPRSAGSSVTDSRNLPGHLFQSL